MGTEGGAKIDFVSLFLKHIFLSTMKRHDLFSWGKQLRFCTEILYITTQRRFTSYQFLARLRNPRQAECITQTLWRSSVHQNMGLLKSRLWFSNRPIIFMKGNLFQYNSLITLLPTEFFTKLKRNWEHNLTKFTFCLFAAYSGRCYRAAKIRTM